MIRKLLKESLLSVYVNERLNEGAEDHPEAFATCVTPQQLAKELNAELHRKDQDSKTRVSITGKDKVIYHRDHIEDYLHRIEGQFDVYPLTAPKYGKSGKVLKHSVKPNFNVIIGTFTKEGGFVPNELGIKRKFKPSKKIPKDTVMAQSAELDVDKFKEIVTGMPKQIFDQNPKMDKTDVGRNQYTVNTGLPAIRAIVWDEEHDTFKYINTCPGAGTCKSVCYARGGFYGMNDGKIIKLIRRLNLLWNDPKKYYQMAMEELIAHASSISSEVSQWDYDEIQDARKSDKQLVIRWNDAGDFFSETYFKIAMSATKQLLKLGYNVKSYAYTKQAKFVDLADDNFIMNFSKGALPDEQSKVDMEKTKYSDIVLLKDVDKNPIFDDLFPSGEEWDDKKGEMKKTKYDINPKTGLPNFVEGGEEKLKKRISRIYKVDLDRLKYQWELPNEEDEKFKYDVIVLPTGDSDIGAQRMDVHKTFLLVH